jgi:hypothetical protein
MRLAVASAIVVSLLEPTFAPPIINARRVAVAGHSTDDANLSCNRVPCLLRHAHANLTFSIEDTGVREGAKRLQRKSRHAQLINDAVESTRFLFSEGTRDDRSTAPVFARQ